jgi:hypothetical protein
VDTAYSWKAEVGARSSVNRDRDELGRALASAAELRKKALERLQTAEARLQELAEQQDVTRGEMSIAQRAVADLTDEISRLQQSLAEAEVDEARERVAAAVRRRDDGAAEAATAIDNLLTLLKEIEEHRRAVVEAQKELRAVTATPGPPPPREPSVLDEPLGRLEAFVVARSDARLIEDAVTAAAKSPSGVGIKKLPEHLQELARQRRMAWIDEARKRTPTPRDEETPFSRGV